MEITKNNIREVIDAYLKENRIKWTTDHEDSMGMVYEIYVGSLECYLQLEYNLDDENDDVVFVQLFTKVDDWGESLYHQTWESDSKGGDTIETEIEVLIQETKRLNSVVNKIKAKIEQIQEICDENELGIDEFITVNYDFD
jgi:hypothetical protein